MKTWQKAATVKQMLKKLEPFKYAILIGMIGVILLLLPERTAMQQSEEQESVLSVETSQADTQKQLEKILSLVEGAGDVRVMLTYKSSEKLVYQMDTVQTSDQNSEHVITDVENKTVLTDSGSSTQVPVVQQTVYPACLGAVVVCEGADSADVRLQLVSAVSNLTGLGADRITVVKMKQK